MPKSFKLENSAAQNRLTAQRDDEPMLADARRIDIEKIVPNPFQVRQNFDSPDAQEALQQLAEDIRERGILQPLVVRQIAPGKYQIIAGERRYRAALMIGKTWLPVILRDMDDEEARMASLVENVQRKDLDIDEEARFLAALANDHHLREGEIARKINKSQPYVAKRLKLAEHHDLLEKVRLGQMTISGAYEEATSRETPKARNDGRTKVGKTQKSPIEIIPAEQAERKLFLRNKIVHLPLQRFDQAVTQIEKMWPNLTGEEQGDLTEGLAAIEARLADLRQRLGPVQKDGRFGGKPQPESARAEAIVEDDAIDLFPTPSRRTVSKR